MSTTNLDFSAALLVLTLQSFFKASTICLLRLSLKNFVDWFED